MLIALRQSVRARRDEMARLLEALVQVPTENPPGRNYGPCLRLLQERLEALGLASVVEPVPGGDADPAHPRFWLRSDWGRGDRALYFHGHYDVVPAQAPGLFEPRVTDETIFGRGSSDMKGGLVSMIYAIKALSDAGVELDGRIGLRVVPDEETGGALGSRALSDAGWLVEAGAVAMLTAEPTSGLVWNASRGAITCRVRVPGRPAHVGLHYRGVNAFERALVLLDALRELKREVEARRTSFPIEPEAARHSILMMGGETAGSANFNVVPDTFSFSIDRRINPEEDFDEEKRRLLETIEAADVGAEVELFQEARPAGVESTEPSAQALASAIAEVRGEVARFELCPGILEIRFYAEKRVPAFAYGPGLLSVSHGPKEFVKRRDLEDCALVYALTAAKLLS